MTNNHYFKKEGLNKSPSGLALQKKKKSMVSCSPDFSGQSMEGVDDMSRREVTRSLSHCPEGNCPGEFPSPMQMRCE